MALTLRWVGQDELDRVAETRMYCYAPAGKELATYKEKIRLDRRGKPGDFLLAERNGEAVGTTTSLSLTMWARGAALPCQGIAYVGTIKTQRRAGGPSGEKGVATQLMNESLRLARERGQVVTALMPFRASFYEHFGYGLIETYHEWTAPISILPPGDFDGVRVARDERDLIGMIECRQRMAKAGQCDIERTREAWDYYRRVVGDGYEIIDRDSAGVVRGAMYVADGVTEGRKTLKVLDQIYDSPAALQRQICFFASLKDQYSFVWMMLPRDVPLNRMLRESQLPHRPVEHGVARVTPATRLQLRVLDHKRFLETINWPAETRGRATVAVKECEGNTSKFRIDVAGGKAQVGASDASADVELLDKDWAAIACGEVTATNAARFGMAQVINRAALPVLDALSIGPAPFCAEYF